jgi:hypothetical protein
MRYKVTSKTPEIVRDLDRLAALVAPYLGFASPAASREWEAFRGLWPSDEDLREGTMAVSEADLESMPAKVRRFGEILRAASFGPADGVEHAAA